MESDVRAFVRGAWGSQSDNFPGPHPISIERKHIPLLRSKEYVVCEKTDGTRYLLVCIRSGGYKYSVLVNRKMDMKVVTVAMPCDTLLDGELIGDTFMIFDAVVLAGKLVRDLNYLDRLREAEAVTKGPKMGLKLQMKTMWPVSAAAEIWSKNPESDGLIFTPVHEPVRMETHETMFKWKPMDRITVDFKLHEGYLCIWDRKEGLVKVQKWQAAEGTILECAYQGGSWVPVKVRTDKDLPNNRRTYMRTMVNIREDIQVTDFTKNM